MRWERALHHLEQLAAACAELARSPTGIVALKVRQLWAYGDLLAAPADLNWIQVALGVDRPPAETPWRGEPKGAVQWANATRLSRIPVVAQWRSVHAPVWNHRIIRPALVWDDVDGLRAAVLAAIRAGDGESVREAAPDDTAYGERMAEELRISAAALRAATADYEDRRWRPGKLEPVADALWRAADGYLDVRAALD
jgi:hypothetical protein